MPHLDTVRAWLAALESNGDAFAFLTDDATQDEMPNKLFPAGRTNDLAAMRANAAKGKQVLTAQTYEIVTALEHGDRVALELHWRGTLAVPFGPLAAGGTFEARIAMFLTFRGEKIAHLRNYDCYPS
jgi:ketosteroid isomerase-like protein